MPLFSFLNIFPRVSGTVLSNKEKMLYFAPRRVLRVPIQILLWAVVVAVVCSCSPSRSSANAETVAAKPASATDPVGAKGPTITLEANGPGDTVRVFYKLLKEKKFREAIFLTNLRPAIEGLTDDELKDFAVDFEALAGQIPAAIEINGEIVSGDQATVTANLPDADGDKNEIQAIKLRQRNGVWIIQTVDAEAEARIAKEGKRYFYNLRVETHEDEARSMLERISKAQLAHSLQHGGQYADMATLIGEGFLPDDIKTSESTGYNYVLELSADKKNYSATATPALYGKSGRLSFRLQPDSKGVSRVASKDNGGKPIEK